MRSGWGGAEDPRNCRVPRSELLDRDMCGPPARRVCLYVYAMWCVCGRSAGPVCAPRGDGLGNRMGLLGAGAECVLR